MGVTSGAPGREQVTMGSVVAIKGSWSPCKDDEWGRSQLERGMCAGVWAKEVSALGWQSGLVGTIRSLRRGLQARLDMCGQGAGAELTRGVVLGDATGLEQLDVYQDVRNLGLSHLVAVSGSHLVVVTGLVAAMTSRASVRPRARLAVLAVVLGLYVVLSGLQPSAIRSYLMTCVALASTLAGRRSHAVSSASVVGLLILLVNPAMAFRMGFMLSLCAVVGLAVFVRYAQTWLECLMPRFVPSDICGVTACTLVAQAATVPITLPSFAALPLAAPLANLVVGPLASAVLACGVVGMAVCTIVPAAAPLALWPAMRLGDLACLAASQLARVPYAAVPFAVPPAPCAAAAVCVALLVYCLWPWPTRSKAVLALGAVAVLMLALLVSWRLLAPARMVMLDVGQGDAILLQDAGSSLLVDTGPDDAIVAALGRNHVVHLDAVLLTHTDADHAAGLAHLRGLVQIDHVIVAAGVSRALRDGNEELWRAAQEAAPQGIVEVRAGDALRVGGFELQVIWPDGIVAGEENDDSLVMVARYGQQDGLRLTALLTGDAESAVVDPLARQGAIGDIDVLKVGHHGSADSTTDTLLAMTRPEVALVSAGEGNRYGHPKRACLDALERADVVTYCTIWNGDVDVRPHDRGVVVQCERHSRQRLRGRRQRDMRRRRWPTTQRGSLRGCCPPI